ncbi:hypothetical protein AFLA_001774 [Aspergillus flavus NRRL3357]|nr:hypothetical protein AFLA_001774 [Aspergillus flavus NRRL3357]
MATPVVSSHVMGVHSLSHSSRFARVVENVNLNYLARTVYRQLFFLPDAFSASSRYGSSSHYLQIFYHWHNIVFPPFYGEKPSPCGARVLPLDPFPASWDSLILVFPLRSTIVRYTSTSFNAEPPYRILDFRARALELCALAALNKNIGTRSHPVSIVANPITEPNKKDY